MLYLQRDQLRALAALAGGEQRAAAARQARVVAAQAAAGRALVAAPQRDLQALRERAALSACCPILMRSSAVLMCTVARAGRS